MSKILIAYYSRKGQNYVSGDIKNLTKGNTEIIAEFIQKAVGGDFLQWQCLLSLKNMTLAEKSFDPSRHMKAVDLAEVLIKLKRPVRRQVCWQGVIKQI